VSEKLFYKCLSVFYQWSLDAFTHTHPHTILWCNAIQHSNILYIQCVWHNHTCYHI